MVSKKTVGVIGCGAIGALLCSTLNKTKDVKKIYIADRTPEKTAAIVKDIKRVIVAKTVEELIDKSDLVIEAASHEAVKKYALTILRKKKDLFIMSVGALQDAKLLSEMERLGKKNGCRIYIPSGGICGVDGIISASSDRIDSVTLETTKPVFAFKDDPYIKSKGIYLEGIKAPVIVFDGVANDAVQCFPKNINVAAIISLVGLGFKKTRVKIIADPKETRNCHRIIVKGAFGELETIVKNVPSPRNPKTSYLAALSAVATLRKIFNTIDVGT